MLILGLFSFYTVVAQKSDSNFNLKVELTKKIGKMYSVWGFGYDESNVTYQMVAKKLISELNEASPVPVYYRTNNLLNTDDGRRLTLKWGSSNVYTEDKKGKPVYDWTTIDKIFDTYLERGGKPNVTLAQMPKALASGPEPYRPHWSPDPNDHTPYAHTVRTAYHYPPSNYKKWAKLIYKLVKHCDERYGKKEVESWYWDVWDEPDLGFWWVGTKEEYFKLYDYTADAIKRALPSAKVGGPASSTAGPNFLRAFLKHCSNGTNYVTGDKGSPLDYITIRTKGKPELAGGGNFLQMGMTRELKSLKVAFPVIKSFTKYKNMPVLIGAADPDGTAAKSSEFYPANDYRNGTLYPSYTASSFAKIFEMADHYKINLQSVASWSFTFVNQPWFAGFRSLATNGIDKPILNLFRMYGMMEGDRVNVTQKDPISFQEVIARGIREKPDVHALATRQNDRAAIMVWNYQDNDLPAPRANVSLDITGIGGKEVLVHHYRIDDTHSNAFRRWRKMGSPQQLSDKQYEKLVSAGQLQLLTSPKWTEVKNGSVSLSFQLPRQGVSLVSITW